MATGKGERLEYVDGLRGIAVLMVLAIHSAAYDFGTYRPGHASAFRIIVSFALSQGYEGVSLFLVLSGFCLALPAYRRRCAGWAGWFDLRQFALRRAWRILPPYYVALLLFTVTRPPGSVGPLNVLSHVLLIHNMTPFVASLNRAFWSLALEWQWYLVFPLVLVATLKYPRATLGGCLVLAAVWHGETHDAGLLFGRFSGVLPARLFEFACGVAVARIVASGWTLPRRFCLCLAALLCLPLVLVAVPPLHMEEASLLGPVQPLLGISFAALLGLATWSPRVRVVFSWWPLVRLGLISYSVYLVHDPVVGFVQVQLQPWLPTHHWLGVTGLAMTTGIAAGGAFYLLIERHFLRPPAFKPRASFAGVSSAD